MYGKEIAEWKKEYEEFQAVTKRFYAGEVKAAEYKGFSGGFGSYAQRGGTASMLRLRLPGGRVSGEKLSFVAQSIRKYGVDCVHLTTCQSIQLHNLNEEAVCALSTEALEYGIVTRGGGGDFPRNVMVSPLTGVEEGEYFDVAPYAEAAADFLMRQIGVVKLPRKLKVCFSNSPANLTHATFRDLGFAAEADGTFTVYSAGGLGNHPKMGVRVATGVDGTEILYYIRAMIQMFVTYGDYKNRGKARTRYMQDTLGDRYAEEFRKMLEEAKKGEDLTLSITPSFVEKKPDGEAPEHRRVIRQKQTGLYAVHYHPIGGSPEPETLAQLCDAVRETEGAEIRIAPDESLYIINCTGKEAERFLALTSDSAATQFEESVACIGASICQVGLRDSQSLMRTLVAAAREWNFTDGVLPKIHISGCPSSCGTHQIGTLGFRGAAKKADGKMQSAFLLTCSGCETQGREAFGTEVGTILETDIPKFLRALGETVAQSGQDFDAWYAEHQDEFLALAKPYTE